MENIKTKLYQHCLNLVQQKVDATDKAMQEAQAAANNETKSSAGDKHEVGRAMMQREVDRLGSQLAEQKDQLNRLKQVSIAESRAEVSVGSLVELSNDMKLMVAVGLGKVCVAGTDYFVVSPASPIGTSMMGKSVGDQIVMGQAPHTITQVY